jgi:hypothetical protein
MGFVVDSDEANLLTKEDLHRVIGMNPVALRYDIMLRILGHSDDVKARLDSLLDELVAEGSVFRDKKNRYTAAKPWSDLAYGGCRLLQKGNTGSN